MVARAGSWRRRAIAVACVTVIAGTLPALASGTQAATATSNQDWPTFLQNSARTSATTDPNLSVAAAPLLKLQWSFHTGAPLAASASIVGTTAYAGSWDGYEYAIDTTTGAQVWKQFIGQVYDADCAPKTLGVTSAATIVGGVVYVGGGDDYWYALDAGTGAVLWKVQTGDTTAGYYNWSSPLIVNGAAYIGIASNCDNPLVRGALLKVDLTTHAVVASYYFVPAGQIGGGVWTSPTYDPATNTVFVTTGTLDDPSQTQSQAVVALDAGTLHYMSSWQLPASEAVVDSDWGTTPTLLTDSGGDPLLAAANKNGVVYAWNRNDLAAGPVWRAPIAVPGACPVCGDGSIASGVFANGVLYYAGGHAVVNGHGSGGSLRALDPATGAVLWTRQTDSAIIGAPAYVNGMVAYVEGSTFEVVDASSGRLLYSYVLPASADAAVSIANSQFYVGALDGNEYAFGLGAAPAPPPADPHCPAGFTCRDVGTHAAGSESTSASGVLTVTASGTPLTTAADRFRSIAKLVTGDSQSRATLVQQSAQTGMAQAGLMVRQAYGTSTDPAAPFFTVVASPNDVVNGSAVHDVVVSYRASFGKTPVRLARRIPTNVPVSLMIQRTGNQFAAGLSFDGVHFQLIPGASASIDLPATTLQGLVASSGTAPGKGTAGFANVAVGAAVSTAMAPVAPAHACPQGWVCTDVGNPAPPGDTTVSSGTLTLTGTGKGFFVGQLQTTNTDAFHFVYRSVAAPHAVSARVTMPTTASSAQGGVMIRANASPSAPAYSVFLTAGGSVTVQWRGYDGILNRYPHTVTTVHSPAYLKITRTVQASPAATTFTAMTSTDGVTWTAVPGSAVTIDMGAGPYLVGLAASAATPGATTPVTFGAIKIS